MRGKVNARYGPSRDGGGSDDDSNRWLGTYGDAVTLLMAFFVMLYAMSEVDAVKFEAFLSGLEGPFGNTSVELLTGGGGIVGPGGSNPEDADEVRIQPTDPNVVQPVLTGPAGNEASEAAQDDLAEARDAVISALEQAGLADVAELRREERGLVVSIGSDDVLFATGSASISDLGDQIVAAIATVLSSLPNQVMVEGHTDDVPLVRSGYTNWNLSTDRAVAVVDALVDDHAIDPQRLGAAGFGEYRPVAPNDSPGNRARNRRVDVLIVAQGDSDA